MCEHWLFQENQLVYEYRLAVRFDFDFMPSGVVGLAFQASDHENILDFFPLLDEPDLDYSVACTFDSLVE
jgi:hypothetical protein